MCIQKEKKTKRILFIEQYLRSVCTKLFLVYLTLKYIIQFNNNIL